MTPSTIWRRKQPDIAGFGKADSGLAALARPCASRHKVILTVKALLQYSSNSIQMPQRQSLRDVRNRDL